MTYKNRDYKHFLKDIYEASTNIVEYTQNYKYENFIADKKVIDAVNYNLIVIGEATKFIPEEVKKELNQIPFDEIAGLRNRLAHDYLGIDLCIIWDIVEFDIPELKNELEKIVKGKQSTMTEPKKQETNKLKKTNKLDIKISSLDFDKAEYQEIVLSNSNFPDKDFYNKN